MQQQGSVVTELIERSHTLGADPRVTNYGGGNTSAKGCVIDPASGSDVEVVWVKGSGGDLGTLTERGLAVLRRDRVQALSGVYRGPQHEDEMVGLFDYCMFGQPVAPPSIDTAMHVLVDAPHVDHLHPDAGIAVATAADGEELTRRIYGARVVWVPWRRPGFQLGLDIAQIQRDHPEAIGCILGGHGITAWGASSTECRQRSLEIIALAEQYIDEHGAPAPFGAVREGYGALERQERHARAAVLAPLLRRMAATDGPVVGHYIDSEVVLDFLSRSECPRLADLGCSCPDHFLRTKIRPLLLDLPGDSELALVEQRLGHLHAAYREDYARYYSANATADSPKMRGADPAVFLIPGVGMFSFGADKHTARVAGEYFVNTINAMRGAEAVSTYAPIPDAEKFRIEYWSLEEAKLARRPKPKPLAARVAFVTGGGHGIGRAIALRLAREGACVVVADLDAERARAVADEIAAAAGAVQVGDVAVAVHVDVSDSAAVRQAVAEAAEAFGGIDIVINNAGLSRSLSLAETTDEDWDTLHGVMARGSFIVSREASNVMIAQGLGGDIIYISSKNAVFAGTHNVAYSAAKADQAHQVRLLAAELGEHSIRVNGVNPDGVVRGSGLFEGGWGDERAKLYGVDRADLGSYYAGRTILKREVVPDDVAAAVAALLCGDLAKTTGHSIPVDSGVAAAFLR